MRRLLVLAAAFGLLAVNSPADTQAKIDDARQAAEAWLALVDQQDYGRSWDEAAGLFQRAVTKPQWIKALDASRKPLGEVKTRELAGAQFATELPGAPDGEYVVLQFRTSFANKKSAVETITPMLDTGGVWRVSGYYIK